MPLELPPLFLLPTRLPPDELRRLEGCVSSLTYNAQEARLVVGNITRTERALFELRRLKLETVPLDEGGGGGSVVGATNTAEVPTVKRRKLSSGRERASDKGLVQVVKLPWLMDSLQDGRVLPVDGYLLYQGLKTRQSSASAKNGEEGRASSGFSTPHHQGSQGQAGGDHGSIASRNQHAAANLDGRRHRPVHAAPPLIHETTSDHEVPLPTIQSYLNTTYSCQRPTPGNSPNTAFLEQLKEVRTIRLLGGDEIGVQAYSTSIATLAAYPHELLVPQEVARLPGCGPKIAELFEQWQEKGQLREVQGAARDPRMAVLQTFYDIWGVGQRTACEFYGKGWRDLDDVLEYGWTSLSRAQQIGVKYYEFRVKMAREVESIAKTILSHAREFDAGFEMTIVGGYRHGKSQSGDVDVMLSHRAEARTAHLIQKLVLRLEELITHTLSLWTANSERDQQPLPWRGGEGPPERRAGFDTLDKAMVWQDSATAQHRRVDIIVSPWKTVGCVLLGWSGGMTFQRDLRRYCKRELGVKFDSSGIRRRADGAWLDLESGGQDGAAPDMETTERQVFDGLGLPWRPPKERCTG